MEKLKFERKVNLKLFMTESKLSDGRTREITMAVLIELIHYVETPRTRRKLDQEFVEKFESSIDELIDARADHNMQVQVDLIENIYELLYLEYPSIKRNFFECMRKRKTRLNENGLTKLQVRRKSTAMKKGSVTKKANAESKKNEREKRLFDAFINR